MAKSSFEAANSSSAKNTKDECKTPASLQSGKTSKSDSRPAFEKKFGFPGDMFKSSDNMLIVLLIILLMDEKENFPLVFALIFLLV